MMNLYSLTRSQLSALLQNLGFAEVHARRLWRYLYRELVTSFGVMNELPVNLLARLEAEASLEHLAVTNEIAASDGRTNKYLLRLHDGQQIETVQMVYAKGPALRVTACLSTQVGCALGCVFCATGQLGFKRNLSAAEIVAQSLHVARGYPAKYQRLGNLVLMGMGEPR
jgi:23S rRNA (adenine2503-C2)-methyltransferase